MSAVQRDCGAIVVVRRQSARGIKIEVPTSATSHQFAVWQKLAGPVRPVRSSWGRRHANIRAGCAAWTFNGRVGDRRGFDEVVIGWNYAANHRIVLLNNRLAAVAANGGASVLRAGDRCGSQPARRIDGLTIERCSRVCADGRTAAGRQRQKPNFNYFLHGSILSAFLTWHADTRTFGVVKHNATALVAACAPRPANTRNDARTSTIVADRHISQRGLRACLAKEIRRNHRGVTRNHGARIDGCINVNASAVVTAGGQQCSGEDNFVHALTIFFLAIFRNVNPREASPPQFTRGSV